MLVLDTSENVQIFVPTLHYSPEYLEWKKKVYQYDQNLFKYFTITQLGEEKSFMKIEDVCVSIFYIFTIAGDRLNSQNWIKHLISEWTEEEPNKSFRGNILIIAKGLKWCFFCCDLS